MVKMSDFYSQGYYMFHFLITPNELENLLQPYHLIITNAHVPADYTESPISKFMPTNELESYSAYAALKKSIMKITKPLCVMINGEQKQTSVRISEEVKKHINNFYFFKNGNITAV